MRVVATICEDPAPAGSFVCGSVRGDSAACCAAFCAAAAYPVRPCPVVRGRNGPVEQLVWYVIGIMPAADEDALADPLADGILGVCHRPLLLAGGAAGL